MFTELHGPLPLLQIKRNHKGQFRERCRTYRRGDQANCSTRRCPTRAMGARTSRRTEDHCGHCEQAVPLCRLLRIGRTITALSPTKSVVRPVRRMRLGEDEGVRAVRRSSLRAFR